MNIVSIGHEMSQSQVRKWLKLRETTSAIDFKKRYNNQFELIKTSSAERNVYTPQLASLNKGARTPNTGYDGTKIRNLSQESRLKNINFTSNANFFEKLPGQMTHKSRKLNRSINSTLKNIKIKGAKF